MSFARSARFATNVIVQRGQELLDPDRVLVWRICRNSDHTRIPEPIHAEDHTEVGRNGLGLCFVKAIGLVEDER